MLSLELVDSALLLRLPDAAWDGRTETANRDLHAATPVIDRHKCAGLGIDSTGRRRSGQDATSNTTRRKVPLKARKHWRRRKSPPSSCTFSRSRSSGNPNEIAGSARFLCRAPENYPKQPDFTVRRRLMCFRTVLYRRICDFTRASPRCRAPASTCWLAAYCGWSDPDQSYGA